MGLTGKRSEAVALGQTIRSVSRPFEQPTDLDPLLERIGNARYVLLGEASHGTKEYYTWRAAISRRLITEMGFSFIAVEGDWPDCYRVNRYIKGYPDSGEDAPTVLHAFHRWPSWMWANEEVADLVAWLREHNRSRPEDDRAGFFGLDMYSLWQSLYAIIDYLKQHDPKAVPAAYQAFRCFEPYGEEPQENARTMALIPESCREEVIRLLTRVQGSQTRYRHDGRDGHFNAEQNARVVRGAEEYYRIMVHGGASTWNIRDRHMHETLERLMEQHGPNARGIVWAHNTHVGDSRYTDMASMGESNIGQFVREAHGADDVVLVGFGSHRGSIIAARAWDAPREKMVVPEARQASWEDIFHMAGPENKLVITRELPDVHGLYDLRGHRAIGVVYHPEREYGNYVPTILPKRYDAFLYIDQTRALSPLPLKVSHDQQLPETYPFSV